MVWRLLRRACGCMVMPVLGTPHAHRSTGTEAPTLLTLSAYEAAWRLSQYSAIPGHMPG